MFTGKTRPYPPLPPMPLSQLPMMKALMAAMTGPAQTTQQSDRRKLLTSSRAMIARGKARRQDAARRAASVRVKER